LAHLCVPRGRIASPLSSSPPRHRRTDKTPFRVASTPTPAIAALTALCHHVESSRHLPPSLLAQACVATMQCAAIKEDPPIYFVHTLTAASPPISRHRRTDSVFYRSIGAKPSHPTSLHVHRSRSSAASQTCSQTSSSHLLLISEPQRWSHAGELLLPRRPTPQLRVGPPSHVRWVRRAPWVLMVKTLP
jgi:hypothetical protein